jgi:hypothetical protein
MSGHLIGCAGTLEDSRLAPSHKLALLAFADSADDRTHIAFPGYEGVQKWAGCSRGRAAELIRDLVGFGYLLQHKKAHRGQRAEYVVFPGGCCDLHRAPTEEPPIDVEQLARAAGVSIDQARTLLEAMAAGTPATDAPNDDPQPNESGTSDAFPVNESGASDPFRADTHKDAPEAVDNPGKGPERVQRSRSTANAFTPSTTTPLTPASGGAGCAQHKTPVPNRRCCGTTPRQLEAAARKAAADQRRAADLAAAAADRAKPRGVKPGTESAKALARAGAAAAKATGPTTKRKEHRR